jgi:hypothetical protein
VSHTRCPILRAHNWRGIALAIAPSPLWNSRWRETEWNCAVNVLPSPLRLIGIMLSPIRSALCSLYQGGKRLNAVCNANQVQSSFDKRDSLKREKATGDILCVLTLFKGRICNIQRDYPISGYAYFFPFRLSDFDWSSSPLGPEVSAMTRLKGYLIGDCLRHLKLMKADPLSSGRCLER